MTHRLLHRIRLGGPWELTCLLRGGSRREHTLKFPLTAAPLGEEIEKDLRESGRIRLRRAFNHPTGMTARDELWLRLPDGLPVGMTVRVNEFTAERIIADVGAWNLTSALVSFNRLELEFPVVTSAGDVLKMFSQPVSLEIVVQEPN